ncbi:MAG: flippase-like domain-containing protein, partial [Acidimicrobiales bacterium]
AFGVSQIVASLPLIPGGLGIVEGSLAVILVAYGAKKVPALAVVLIYRLLTFWAVIIVGWISIAVIEWRVRRESTSLTTGPVGTTGSEI